MYLYHCFVSFAEPLLGELQNYATVWKLFGHIIYHNMFHSLALDDFIKDWLVDLPPYFSFVSYQLYHNNYAECHILLVNWGRSGRSASVCLLESKGCHAEISSVVFVVIMTGHVTDFWIYIYLSIFTHGFCPCMELHLTVTNTHQYIYYSKVSWDTLQGTLMQKSL